MNISSNLVSAPSGPIANLSSHAPLNALIEGLGRSNIGADIMARDATQRSVEWKLKSAIQHYERTPNIKNGNHLIKQLKKTLKILQREKEYAEKQKKFHEKQVEQQSQQSYYSLTGFGRWALDNLKDYFGSSPQALFEKYVLVAEKRQQQIDHTQRVLDKILQETQLRKRKTKNKSKTVKSNTTAATVVNPIPDQRSKPSESPNGAISSFSSVLSDHLSSTMGSLLTATILSRNSLITRASTAATTRASFPVIFAGHYALSNLLIPVAAAEISVHKEIANLIKGQKNPDELKRLIEMNPHTDINLEVDSYTGDAAVHYVLNNVNSAETLKKYLLILIDAGADFSKKNKLVHGNFFNGPAVSADDLLNQNNVLDDNAKNEVRQKLNIYKNHRQIKQNEQKKQDELNRLVQDINTILNKAQILNDDVSRMGLLINRFPELEAQKQKDFFETAVKNKHHQIVKLFIDKGIFFDQIGVEGKSPLQVAIAGNDIFTFNVIFSERYDNIETVDLSGHTVIHTLVSSNKHDILKRILSNDKLKDIIKDLINKKDFYGDTPLHTACKGTNDNVGVVDLLIEKGARVDIKDSFGNLPIVYAVSGGLEKIHAALKKEYTVDITSIDDIVLGKIEITEVEKFKDKLAKEVKDNPHGLNGRTLIHLAVINQNKIALRHLLQNEELKNLIDHRDDFGFTALEYTLTHPADFELVEILIDHRANLREEMLLSSSIYSFSSKDVPRLKAIKPQEQTSQDVVLYEDGHNLDLFVTLNLNGTSTDITRTIDLASIVTTTKKLLGTSTPLDALNNIERQLILQKFNDNNHLALEGVSFIERLVFHSMYPVNLIQKAVEKDPSLRDFKRDSISWQELSETARILAGGANNSELNANSYIKKTLQLLNPKVNFNEFLNHSFYVNLQTKSNILVVTWVGRILNFCHSVLNLIASLIGVLLRLGDLIANREPGTGLRNVHKFFRETLGIEQPGEAMYYLSASLVLSAITKTMINLTIPYISNENLKRRLIAIDRLLSFRNLFRLLCQHEEARRAHVRPRGEEQGQLARVEMDPDLDGSEHLAGGNEQLIASLQEQTRIQAERIRKLEGKGSDTPPSNDSAASGMVPARRGQNTNAPSMMLHQYRAASAGRNQLDSEHAVRVVRAKA